ncbi:hypothetical protein ACMFMG_003246 [Clarireedia jacksonii]
MSLNHTHFHSLPPHSHTHFPSHCHTHSHHHHNHPTTDRDPDSSTDSEPHSPPTPNTSTTPLDPEVQTLIRTILSRYLNIHLPPTATISIGTLLHAARTNNRSSRSSSSSSSSPRTRSRSRTRNRSRDRTRALVEAREQGADEARRILAGLGGNIADGIGPGGFNAQSGRGSMRARTTMSYSGGNSNDPGNGTVLGAQMSDRERRENIRRNNLAVQLANAFISQNSPYAEVHPKMNLEGAFPRDFNTPRAVYEVVDMPESQLNRLLRFYGLPIPSASSPSLQPRSRPGREEKVERLMQYLGVGTGSAHAGRLANVAAQGQFGGGHFGGAGGLLGNRLAGGGGAGGRLGAGR